MTTERQALVDRLNSEARHVEVANSYGRDVLAPLLRSAVEELEALSSSAPVETPAMEVGLSVSERNAFAAGWNAHCHDGQRWSFGVRDVVRHHSGEALAAYQASLLAAPVDPPIPSPGDEERKDEIAKRARRAIDAVVHECGNEVFLGVGYAPDEMLIEELQQALSDYEIKAGSK